MSKEFYSAYEHIIGTENMDLSVDPPVLLPPVEEALSDIVRMAVKEKLAISVLGSGTLPALPPIKDSISLSTAHLDSILEVNPDDFLVRSQAGAVVDKIINETEEHKLVFPLDITSGADATVGGAYMAGAIGPSTLGFGAFHDSVIGVRCINAQGDIVTGGGRTAKNVTGYDLTRFFAGTMGLFGIACELTIKALPLPEIRLVVKARFIKGSDSLRAVRAALSDIREITMLEIIAPDGLGGEVTVAVGCEGMEKIIRRSQILLQDVMKAAGADDIILQERKAFTNMRREASKNLVNAGFITLSVPPRSSEKEMKKIRLSGLGRIHTVANTTDMKHTLGETTLAVGGKSPVDFSILKSKGLSFLFTGSELKIARALKRSLDPANTLNPHLNIL